MADEINPEPALCHSARTGNVNYINRLIKDYGKALKINWQDGTGNTALHYASLQNHPQAVTLLLSNGADANVSNLQGDTPLHLASRKNLIEVIQILISHGADKNKANKKKVTPLTEVRSDEARRIIKFSVADDELDADMLADADDRD